MALTSRREQAPTSIDGVRRNIQKTVHAVERETYHFVSEYSGNIGTPESWLKFVQAACVKMRKDSGSLKTFNDLKPVLSRARDYEEMTQNSNEYLELRRMIKRGKRFEYVAFSLRNELVDVYETQLERFCLSFYQETREETLKSVQDYEHTIGVCRREIKDRMALVDRLLDEADKHKDSLVDYIHNYSFVVGRMVDACQALAGVCTPIKKWLAADAGYTHKIQEEITSYTRRKLDLQDVIKEQEEERQRHAKRLRKTAIRILTWETKLKEYNEEKRVYKRRETDVQDRYLRCEAELQRKRNDLEEVCRNQNHGEKTPTMNAYHSGMAEALRNEVRTMAEKLDRMDAQMKGLREDQEHVQKDIDQLTDQILEGEKNHTEARERCVKCDEELRGIIDDIRQHAAKITALKKVREVKLHSDTLKKIYHYGYNPELILEAKGSHGGSFTSLTVM